MTDALAVGCGVATIVALEIIGLSAHEIVRHNLQALPMLIAVILMIRRARYAAWLAAPCFAIWTAVSVLIWLFLAGVSRVVTGHYPPIEIAMTVVLAVAGVVGIVANARGPRRGKLGVGIAVALIMLAAQIAAMALSFTPAFAHD